VPQAAPGSDAPAFDFLVNQLQQENIVQFRPLFLKLVQRLRPMFSTLEPYVRPTQSRGIHPFIQRDLPEVTRDKFKTGASKEFPLSKDEFVALAILRPSPHSVADSEAAERLPTDLRLAIDHVFLRGPAIQDDRRERLAQLAAIVAELEPMRASLDKCKCATAKQVAHQFNSAWAALVIDAMRWPDFELPLRYVTGFPVVFDIADSGVFKADFQEAETSPANFKANNTKMVAQIFSELDRARTDPLQRERREQCWSKTKKEIKAGLVNGPFSKRKMDRKYGRGKWRCLGRNAILQKEKWRCIDNGKRSKHNVAMRMHERITCGRADFPVTIAREFARRMHQARSITKNHVKRNALLRMEHGTMDLAAAYRHVPTSQPEYTCVAVIDTDADRVVACEVPGHNFGLTSAVVNFNRYPELVVAVSRRLTWTVSEPYYDDADTTEPGYAGQSGQACLAAIAGPQFFGFGFDEEQTELMAPRNDFLGVTSDLSHGDSGYVVMDVSSSRKAKIKQLVQEVLLSKQLRSGLAASLFGKARFMLSPCYGSLGKACLPPLNLRSRQKSAVALNAELLDSLEFIEFACDALPPLRLPCLPVKRDAIVIFTDAEGKKRKGNRPPSGHLGFVVYHPVHGKSHAYGAVPQSIVDLLDAIKVRETYIGQFELIAAITPFISLPPEWFEGYPVELWIDNSSAMYILIKDYSGIPDCSRIANMFHFAIARLGLASLWVDFVNTESNPADDPSRAHEMGGAASEKLSQYGQLVPMRIPEFASEDGQWLSLIEIARSVW